MICVTSTVQLHCIQNISVCSKKLGVSEGDKGSQWKQNHLLLYRLDSDHNVEKSVLWNWALPFFHTLPGTDSCAEVSPLPHSRQGPVSHVGSKPQHQSTREHRALLSLLSCTVSYLAQCSPSQIGNQLLHNAATLSCFHHCINATDHEFSNL